MKTSTYSPGSTALPESIRKTLSNTFITVGGMWAITAVTGYMALGAQFGLMAALGMFAASIACIFAVFAFRNSVIGLGLLGVFSALQGVSMGPLLNHYLQMQGGAQMVTTAAGLTAAATFACAAYAMTARRSFRHLHAFLFAGLIVFLLASIAGIFIQMPMFHLVLSGVGCLLFTAWLLYDISEVVNGSETNYITAALGIYLDMVNLFMNLLKFLGLVSSND